jgi:hypothetical protein
MAHTFAYLRIADPISGVGARLATGSGGLTLGRAGFAPAGRQTKFHDVIASSLPFDPHCLVALFFLSAMRMSSVYRFGPQLLLGSSLVVLGVGWLLQAPRAVTHDAKVPAVRCIVRNVAGTYGFVGSGTVLPNAAGFPEGPVATVDIQTFDGHGEWVT